MAIMRTIPKAVEELRARDPECPITVEILRRMVKSGQVPHVSIPGTRTLIDVDRLEAFFAGGTVN